MIKKRTDSNVSEQSRRSRTSHRNQQKEDEIDYAKYGRGIIPEQDVKLFYATFKKYDQNKNGLLSIIQLQKLMKEGGLTLNLATIQHIFKQVKSLKKPGMSFEDLIETMLLKNNEVEQIKDYERIFSYYDKQKRGYFTYEDYLKLWGNCKQKFHERQLKKAFDLMDSEGNGKVTFDDFVRTMKKSS